MKKKVFLIIVILIATSKMAFGQNIQKNFLGWWGDTRWEFNFHKNGSFERISSGHFGFTTTNGTYKIENDTIKIISSDKNTYGTINEEYIIDENNILIDLNLGYGYPIILDFNRNKQMNLKEILYPEVIPINSQVVDDIQEVLNLAFNSKKIKQFYHFDITSRQFIIANYFKLKANIVVDGRNAIFKNKKDINEKFYIEFETITRYNDNITFTIKIPDEGARIMCYYDFENGKWKEIFINVEEN